MLDPVRWKTADGAVLVGPDAAAAPWTPGKLRLIDQTKLPGELAYLETDDLEVVHDAIRRLVVRGAPAIGCAAALGLAAVAGKSRENRAAEALAEIESAADYLATSRPTAVNLFWALDRCRSRARAALEGGADAAGIRGELVRGALEILAGDIAMCRAIGAHGAKLLRPGMGVLTHCNAGALATGDYGTALSPIYVARENGVDVKVYSDETRPLLQGSRLTAWELRRTGVDVTTICDNMAAQVMREGKIDLVIVGADRIAANGDAANKIGTYGVAILARHHGIPFHVAAPTSTIDPMTAAGDGIPIEQRDGDEIRRLGDKLLAPPDVKVYNPAFDVTPNTLITSIITEKGIISPPYPAAIEALLDLSK